MLDDFNIMSMATSRVQMAGLVISTSWSFLKRTLRKYPRQLRSAHHSFQGHSLTQFRLQRVLWSGPGTSSTQSVTGYPLRQGVIGPSSTLSVGNTAPCS